MLNSPAQVNEATRRLIQREIDRLGYTANGAARALAFRQSRTIGAIIPSINNLLSAKVLDGFQRVMEREGYELLLSSFEQDPSLILRKAENFVKRGVDAVFIVSGQHDDELYSFLQSRDVPFITTWPAKPQRPVPSVSYDYREAALKPVRYLLDLGHRDFALITGPLGGNKRLRDRHDAVEHLLRERGFPLRPERVIDVGSYDLATSRRAFQVLCGRGQLPTAVVATNDIIAGGVILECFARGISVPAELSVAGFGDIDIAAQFSPSITTVRTPRTELGSLAATYLIRSLRGEDAIDDTTLDVELIVRESTGSP
jgi:LacI family transcriptional regulator